MDYSWDRRATEKLSLVREGRSNERKEFGCLANGLQPNGLWGLGVVVLHLSGFAGCGCNELRMIEPGPGIFLPTAGTEPPATGLPDRLDRLPVKIGQTQIWIQNPQLYRFRTSNRPVRPVYRSGLTGYRSVWPVTGRFRLNSNFFSFLV